MSQMNEIQIAMDREDYFIQKIQAENNDNGLRTMLSKILHVGNNKTGKKSFKS